MRSQKLKGKQKRFEWMQRSGALTPQSLLPTPYSPLPIPHSLVPTPYSPLPTPYFYLCLHHSLLKAFPFHHHRQKPLLPQNNFAQEAHDADPKNGGNVNAPDRRYNFARWCQKWLGRHSNDVEREALEICLRIPGQHNAKDEQERHDAQCGTQ